MRVEIDTGELDSASVATLRDAESRRARELASEGHLLAIWRIPGSWANVGIWSASSADELRELLESLPFHPYLRSAIEPLEPHPNDPRLSGPSA